MKQAMLALLPFMLGVAVGGGGCDRLSHGCTLVGCTDQVSISLQQENGARPNLAVSLDIDGRTVDCPAPLSPSDDFCAVDVQISSRELVSCVEENTASARVLKCTGTGKFEEVISIRGTPTAIHATVRNPDIVVAERTFEPRYMTVQPNGPDCEPTCRQWGDVWMLP